jgi:Domain of unknown function (DUF4174)
MQNARLAILALAIVAAALPANAFERTAAAASVANDAAPSLAELRGKARPLVIFADAPDDPGFAEQLELLGQGMTELNDRDVVILTDTDPAAKGPLRQALRPHGFGMVLIDKDGTVAQRRPAPTEAREIINLIDRMPSRRQETGSLRN